MNLKRYLFIWFFFLTTCLSAQKIIPQFKLGIDAGPGLTHLRGNEYLNAYYHSTFGYASGLSVQVRVPKSIVSFKGNVLVEHKGAESEDLYSFDELGNITNSSRNKIHLTYIVFPAMVRVNTNKPLSFFINAGAYAALLLKEEDVLGAIDTVPQITVDNTDGDNKTDGGFCAGMGFTFPVQEKFTASFEVRDNIGVYDINNTPRTKGGIVQTNSINFLAGISVLIQRNYRRH